MGSSLPLVTEDMWNNHIFTFDLTSSGKIRGLIKGTDYISSIPYKVPYRLCKEHRA